MSIQPISANDGRNTGEPEWLSLWRSRQGESAGSVPHAPRYGLGVTGAVPGRDPRFGAQVEYQVNAEKAIEVYTWNEALATEEVSPILRGIIESEVWPHMEDAVDVLADSGFLGGIVIYAQPAVGDDGAIRSQSMTLMSTLRAASGDASDVVFVIAKEGAHLALTLEYAGGEPDALWARTVVVVAEGGADVGVVHRGEEPLRGTLRIRGSAMLGAHASCSWIERPSTHGLWRSHVAITLAGESSRGLIAHRVRGHGSARYDLFGSVRSRAQYAMGRQYAFGSVRDTSRVIYRAHGEIGKGVAGADLAQEGRFLVLSPEAHVDAIPALDIASYDGSASHRLAVSPIPESARFFVAMRGLSRRDGEALIEDGIEREIDDQVSRFCGPLLSRIFRPEEQTDHSVTPSLIP